MNDIVWHKSGRSLTESSCVEVGVEVGVWAKSSRSTNGSQCVEVAGAEDGVLVRDTKDRDGGTLTFSGEAWRAFLDGVKGGEFDL
jgi:hypothetical protein